MARIFAPRPGTHQIVALNKAGYRVVAPDQIGFCTSTKPPRYQFSFQQLAYNTHALLKLLGVSHAIIIGHSTGGMLAARYALMFPDETQGLVLVNPIGLEDWKALGVPSPTIDQWRAREAALTADKIRALRAVDLLRRRLETRIPALGRHARGPRSGPRPRHLRRSRPRASTT